MRPLSIKEVLLRLVCLQIIFSTPDIWNESKWSDAVHFDFEGYDTSPFWDDDGTEYIVGSHAYRVQYV